MSAVTAGMYASVPDYIWRCDIGRCDIGETYGVFMNVRTRSANGRACSIISYWPVFRNRSNLAFGACSPKYSPTAIWMGLWFSSCTTSVGLVQTFVGVDIDSSMVRSGSTTVDSRWIAKNVSMQVHLVDGTYELFRQHFGATAGGTRTPGEFDATTGVLASTIQLLADGATHVGVASDHSIESFRNELFDGYKDGSGMPPELTVQIPLMEEALVALGVTVWPMVEYEADDALASAAAVANADQRVERVLIVTPDKDLGQCVVGDRVVQFDRRKGLFVNEAGVVDKFGVPPESIADWLALVGDTADGIPGLPGWGAKSTSSVLARYGHLEEIPDEAGRWDVPGLRGAVKLAGTLAERRDDAMLFRTLATVVTNVDVGSVDDWEWSGAAPEFSTLCDRIGAPHLVARVERLNR
ncbi:MAG: 5'-3' exonuclease [Ilumatobacteraceae bacterium]